MPGSHVGDYLIAELEALNPDTYNKMYAVRIVLEVGRRLEVERMLVSAPGESLFAFRVGRYIDELLKEMDLLNCQCKVNFVVDAVDA